MFSVYADGQLIYFPLEDDLTIHTPKLTLEMGKAGSFQFGLPPTNRFYDRLSQLKTIITVECDGTELFRGRVLKINRGFNKIKQVFCEGDLAYLVDSVQKGEKYTGTTVDLFYKLINNHNSRVEASKRFTVGNVTIPNRQVLLAGTSDDIKDAETGAFNYKQIALNSIVDNWETTYDFIQDTIIDYCGGYLRTRRIGNTTYLDLLSDYGNTSLQKIDFGKNLIDLTEEVATEDLYTVLIPLGENNLTIASVNNGSDELVDTAGVALFGRIVKTNTFSEVNKAETLLENAKRMLEEHENMPITITVKAVDMHLVDNSAGMIRIGDKVYVNSVPHDIDRYLTCTKIEYDLDNHANDTYTFGNPKQTMTQRYRKDKSKSSKGSKGGSGSGGGAAASAAAESASTELQEFAKEEGKRINAWLDIRPEQGQISLGAFYEKWNADRKVFANNVGIDLDAVKGTVDIFSMNTTLNEQGKAISTSEARIQTLANDIEAYVKQFASFKTQYTESHAELLLKANATESKVNLYAQFIDKNRRNIETIASIEATANSTEATLEGYARFIDKNRNGIESIAGIKATANATGAKLETYAKYIDANKQNINSIASIVQTANEHGSKIGILAQYQKDNDKAIKSIAGIQATANENHASIVSLNQFKTDTSNAITSINQQANELSSSINIWAGYSNELGTHIASISVKADELESSIGLKADKVTVEADILDAKKVLRAEFNEIVANKISAGFTSSGGISCNNLFSSNLVSARNGTFSNDLSGSTIVATKTLRLGDDPVATQKWVKDLLKDYVTSKEYKSHKHDFAYGHTHKYKNGTSEATTSAPNTYRGVTNAVK